MKIKADVAIHISILLSTANILGSSGLMVWIDHALQYESAEITVYYPLIFYLLGLSSGCCILGAFGSVNQTIISKRFFLFFLFLAFSVCSVLAVGDGFFSDGLDLFLRFLWGGVSGCTVILARAMLASPSRTNAAYKNFTVLSFSLASLPLVVPAVFSFFLLNQRSTAAIFAAIAYALTLVLFLLGDARLAIDVSQPADSDPGLRSGALNCLTLIISNVVFFLVLMLVPMVNALSDPGFEIVYLYTMVFCIWLGVGWAIFRYFQTTSSALRLKLGYWVQSIILASCLWVAVTEKYSIFYFIFLLVFISNMLVQPTLFLLLGRHTFNRLLLFGLQSGIYIFIVCILLGLSVFLGFSLRSTFLLLSGVVTISLACLHLFLLDFRKLNI